MSEKISVGGQALIEGVMMRAKNKISIVVRKSDGEFVFQDKLIKNNERISKIPILRGMVALVGSMIVGVKALSFSAEYFAEEDEAYEMSNFDKWVYDKFGDKAENIIVGISMVMALVLAFLLFGLAPTYLSNLFKYFTNDRILLSALEGIMKIVIFVTYLAFISHMKDIKRVFQYHGAEHKSIYTYESGKDLTVENAREFGRLHPRCGTNFLAIVLLTSIFIFSFLSWESVALRVMYKVMLLPLIAGFSYEIIKLAGKSDNIIFKIISYPGMMMQKITTSEPDDEQLEVALEALKRALDNDN
ncbi:MAG TPA: DUF1385 domain-containing protein [Clostridia bacterium]|nr:DUF1385 domain-containing protein [Clostridia bacterium]